MNIEIWKVVKDYTNYKVSNLGNVRHITNKNLRKFCNKSGYNKVSLYHPEKSRELAVHRLVAIAFIDNPLNLLTVDHIDRNPFNNKLDNLRWASHSEQNQNKTKKSQNANHRQIYQLNKDTKEIIKLWDSLQDIENELGIIESNVRRVCKRNGELTSGGYSWKYNEDLIANDEIFIDAYTDESKTEKLGIQVSNYGRLKIIANNIINGNITQEGYMIYTNKNKKYQVHRLVAYSFLDSINKSDNQIYINHKDSNKTNNKVDNLEWCSAYENNIHKILNNGEARKVVQYNKDNSVYKIYDSMEVASKETGINKNTLITRVKRGVEFINGFKFKYETKT